MQTSIIYNGIRFVDVLTEEISHTPVTDSTGVDQVGIEVVGTWTAIVHCSQADQNAIGHQVNSLGSINEVLRALSTNRRRFTLAIGPAVIYDVGAGAIEPGVSRNNAATTFGGMDIDNGPKAECRLISHASGYSATVRFTIRFVVPTCTRKEMGSGLINFRYWILEDVDCDSWLTSRTYEGVLQVAHKNVDPHALAREIAIPPLQRGFRREVIQMHESEDGLRLHFTLRDQEVISVAPWFPAEKKGATKWSGKLQVSTQDFSSSLTALNFTLQGPKGTSKAALHNLAMRIVSAKTNFVALSQRAFGKKDSAFLKYFAAEEDLAENAVAYSCQIYHTGDEQRQILNLFGLNGNALLGKPLGDLGIGFDDQVAFHPGTSATLVGRFLSALQTPCNPARMPQAITKKPTDKYQPEEGSGDGKKISPPDYVPSYYGEKVSPGHLSAMYLNAELHSDLILNSGKIALPTGGASNDNAPTRAVIQLFRPTADRVICLKACRVDAPPEMPQPNETWSDSNGIEHVMIGEAELKSEAPQLSADGRKLLYRGEIAMRYSLSRPPRKGESISVGTLPYRSTSPGDVSRKIPAQIFVAPAKLLD